jgi:hypothetical protein
MTTKHKFCILICIKFYKDFHTHNCLIVFLPVNFISVALPGHSGARPLIQFRNHFSQTVGLLGRVISSSQGIGNIRHPQLHSVGICLRHFKTLTERFSTLMAHMHRPCRLAFPVFKYYYRPVSFENPNKSTVIFGL